jgi:hypothetical protein
MSHRTARVDYLRGYRAEALSSEVDTGSREEDAI